VVRAYASQSVNPCSIPRRLRPKDLKVSIHSLLAVLRDNDLSFYVYSQTDFLKWGGQT